jgi:cytochrome b
VSAATRVRVWDPVVRVTHWLLVLAVVTSWLTRHAPGGWHEWLGYGALAIVALRLVWGWAGSDTARFARFVRSPRETLAYARQIASGGAARYLGHNPLGGWMIVALLTVTTLVCASGWLYTTDRFWGIEWVERVHGALTDALIVLVVLHIAGVAFSSWRHRENLIGAMVHGYKKWLPGLGSNQRPFD